MRNGRAMTGDGAFPGRLFIVEGIDGSGKSTQLDLLYKWLVSQGYLVVFTEWNSSPIVKATTRGGKRQRLLSPISFSLIHAADFANRIHAQILPALQAGAIVLADRYVYTAFARDAVRGVSRPWLRRLYSYAVQPTLAFYFDGPRRGVGGRDRAQVLWRPAPRHRRGRPPGSPRGDRGNGPGRTLHPGLPAEGVAGGEGVRGAGHRAGPVRSGRPRHQAGEGGA